MKKVKPEHLVLIGPSGKQAGLRNQHMIACKLQAIHLNSVGLGGGITNLLLPKNSIESAKLRKYISRGYTVKTSVIRNSTRQTVRNVIKSDQLIVTLAEEFLAAKGSSPRSMAAPVREFSNWICEQLKDHRPNQVRNIVAKAHPDLVDRTEPDWWRKQIAQRKK